MKRILPTIVIAQFLCTSLWFAGNAIMVDIVKQYHIEPSFLAHLTSAVQFGFIIGTLLFAIFSISDRFSPSLVFFGCAIVAACINLAISIDELNISSLITLRFATGFFLAGIYPVGMKIASDYYQKGLGKSLGFLVGALVLGTAFPHLLKSIAFFSWKYVIFATSGLAVFGGLAIFKLIPDGPYRQAGQQLRWSAFLKGFKHSQFKAAAFGYFGHMWELYAFWVFVPVILENYKSQHPTFHYNTALLSFLIIAIGSISCVFSGVISQRFGVKKTAIVALSLSCTCCLLSPFLLNINSSLALLIFLFIWSIVVIADSPLFSTLIAQNADPQTKGTSLTIVNCIGFAITIISIQLISVLQSSQNINYIFVLLAIGPILGLIALLRIKNKKAA